MHYDHGSLANQQQAASLFNLLERGLREANPAPEHTAISQSPKWSKHWRLCNVAGVHAYETAQGWRADLAFTDLPAGIPTLIGNSIPLPTREEAIESAVFKLSVCAESERAWLADFDETMLWFAFDEITMAVDPDYLPGRAVELAREGYTQDMARGRLAYLRHLISGDEPLTEAAFAAAAPELQERFPIVCQIAMALGLTEFTLADGVWAEYMPTAPGPMQ